MITMAKELLRSNLEGHAISPGGEGIPFFVLYGGAPPKGVSFSGFKALDLGAERSLPV